MERFTRLQTVLLSIMTLLALGAVLHFTQQVVLPLVIAILLTFIFVPFVDRMRRARIPVAIGIIVVMFILLMVIMVLAGLLSSSVYALAKEYPRYQTRFTELYSLLKERFKLDLWLFNDLSWLRTLGSYVVSLSGKLVSVITYTLLVVLFLLFLLMEQRHLPRKMIRALRRGMTARIARVMEHIAEQISRYLLIKFFISLTTGLVVWFVYSLIGLDFAFIWGLMAFLFNFIPNIGSTVVWAASSVFAVIQFYPSWHLPIAVSASMLVIQITIGNVIEPKLTGESLNLSPVIVLFSLLMWGWIWGIAGMFIAVPLTVIIKIICENIPALKAVSIFMGTAPPRPKR
ncbi:AI-2E family transporter [Spirochaetia bacterium 38H-sp]|uniref:AI-2E family transporter n=1 Tax=Rarispira pelagica TaxID=3141764 RepID=A0ABU9UCL6_9SPIR